MILMLIFLLKFPARSISLVPACAFKLCLGSSPFHLLFEPSHITAQSPEAGTFAGATWARIALRVFFPACAALNPRNERAAEFDMYSPDFPAAIRDQSFQLLAAFLLLLPEKRL